MEQKPQGVLNSTFRHKCLNVPFRRYREMIFAATVGYVYAIYKGRTNSNVISVSYMTQAAWEIAQPINIDEERALMFTAGTIYGSDNMKVHSSNLYGHVQTSLGLNLDIEQDIKLETITDILREKLIADPEQVEQNILLTEAAALQEVIGKAVNPIEN